MLLRKTYLFIIYLFIITIFIFIFRKTMKRGKRANCLQKTRVRKPYVRV